MLTLFFVQLIGLISPGPDFFYVCRTAMANSRRSAMLGAIGITLGIGFWSLIVLFGLTFLNRHIPQFQTYLMLLGGSYLAYSGLKMLQIKKNAQIEPTLKENSTRTAWQEILAGLIINLSNPKVVVFFSSVLAGYVSKLTTWQDSLLVLAILMGSTLVWFWLVALLFSQSRIRHFYTQHSRYLDNFAGAVFLLFGFSLLYESISTLF